MDGFLIIDKPAGLTSHDVVQRVRRILRQKKAGHTGTLDPFAVGVLPVALGEGTKAIPFLEESEKEYRGTLRLGVSTDTLDCTGAVLTEREWRGVTEENVREAMRRMVGEQEQLPPMYSAVKRGGVPLYRLARKGETVEREPRRITVFSFSAVSIDLPLVSFTVRCSRGTYVRSLADDLGETLGCGAHLTELRRTASGLFGERESVTLEQLEDRARRGEGVELLLSLNHVLAHFPEAELGTEGVRKVSHGIYPPEGDVSGCVAAEGETVRLTHAGSLVALAVKEAASYRLLRVFR